MYNPGNVPKLCALHASQAAGKNPYVIPVGGSSALGTWGYLQVRRAGGRVGERSGGKPEDTPPSAERERGFAIGRNGSVYSN